MFGRKIIICIISLALPAFAENATLPCAFHAGAPEPHETEACTGNFSLSVPVLNTDLTLVYHSAPSALDNEYTAKGISPWNSYPFGLGWKWSIDSSVIPRANEAVLVTSDGTSYRFIKDAQGNYQAQDLTKDRSFLKTNIKQGNTFWERTAADGSKAFYESCDVAACYVTKLLDPNGNEVNIQRSGPSITGVAGALFNGVTVQRGFYGYIVTDKLGTSTGLNVSEKLSWSTNPPELEGLTVPISGEAQKRIKFEYGYFPTIRLTSYTNLLGQVTRLDYYNNGPLKSITDTLNYRTSFTYSKNKVTIKSVVGSSDENFVGGKVIGYQKTTGEKLDLDRDATTGLVTKATLNGELVTKFENYLGNFPQTIRSPDGLVKEIQYGQWMLPKQITTRGPSGSSSTSYTYDSSNRVTQITTDSVSTDYEYWGNTRLPSAVKRGGKTLLQYTYDSVQRLVSVRNMYGLTIAGLDNANVSYDLLGRPTSITKADGSSQSLQYGELGVAETVTTNFGTVTGVQYKKIEIR
jgi:YD repeat-containing protein